MTATANKLGLAAYRALALGTGNWRATHVTAMDNLEDRLTLTATKSPNAHKAANFIGQHAWDSVNKKLYVAQTVGTATTAGLFLEALLATRGLTTTQPHDWTKQQYATPYTATDKTSIVLDLAKRNNFSITATANITLKRPTGIAPGQSGAIVVMKAAAGVTLTLGTAVGHTDYWHTPYATGAALSTIANSVDMLSYYVLSATKILLVTAKRFKNV